MSIETALKEIKGVVIFQEDVLTHPAIREQLEKKNRLNVKSRFREKQITINEAQANLKLLNSINFLGYNISGEVVQPKKRLVEKLFAAKTPPNVKEHKIVIGLAFFTYV